MTSLPYRDRAHVEGTFDVIVIGGGPSGLSAAVAAARAGASTCLIERNGTLGGNNSSAGIGPFMPSYSVEGKRPINRGIFEELVHRMVSRGGALDPAVVHGVTPYTGWWRFAHDHLTPFSTDVLRLTAAELCLEAGVELRLHTVFVAPLIRRGRVRGVITTGKAGLQAFRSTVVIDCSGDADVARRAGVPMARGRADDGRMMPMTLFFRLCNVDTSRLSALFDRYPGDRIPFATLVEQARTQGRFPVPAKRMLDLYLEPDGHHWRLNMTKITGLDGTDPRALTFAQLEGLRQVFALVEFLREHVEGFERAVLADTAEQVYVRETFRIVGDYVLTAQDVSRGRHFADAVAYGSWPIDVPLDTVEGSGTLTDDHHRYPTADRYSIPYRCLLPTGVEQLLVAGRALSATHEAAAAVRIEPSCAAMGQAAGTAAALAVANRTTVRNVDTDALRNSLAEAGAYIESFPSP